MPDPNLKVESPFYRVGVKALVFDDQRRLLLVKNRSSGMWELPGGGWEHDDESLAACVEREFQEELGVGASFIGDIETVYRKKSPRGHTILRLLVRAEVTSRKFRCGDGMVEARYLSREEIAAEDRYIDDEPLLKMQDIVWQTVA